MKNCMFADQPIKTAIKNNHPACLTLLIKLGFDINANIEAWSSKMSPLHFASMKGYLDCMDILCCYKANANAKDEDGDTPLHLILRDEVGSINCIVNLLKHGADINIKNKCEDTPLHIAASNGCADYVAILLKHGADPNIKNDEGATSLHMAVYENREDCMELLLRHGADPNIKNYEGETPLSLAEYEGNSYNIELLSSMSQNLYE